jgi:hypothetical protein
MNPDSCGVFCYEASALGDLDGDGTTSNFSQIGRINVGTWELKKDTQIFIHDELE